LPWDSFFSFSPAFTPATGNAVKTVETTNCRIQLNRMGILLFSMSNKPQLDFSFPEHRFRPLQVPFDMVIPHPAKNKGKTKRD
jgi:hypothetical protein